MRVARTEEQPPNIVPIGDTQPVWQVDPRTEDGSWAAYRMSIVGLAVAIVVALAAVGIGVLMLTTSPDSVAGPPRSTGRRRCAGDARRPGWSRDPRERPVQPVRPGPRGRRGPRESKDQRARSVHKGRRAAAVLPGRTAPSRQAPPCQAPRCSQSPIPLLVRQ